MNLKFDMAKSAESRCLVRIVRAFDDDALIRVCCVDQSWDRTNRNIRQFFMGQINTRYYDCILICLFCADHVYFTGIEMSSVYITRLENPVKTYIRGVFAALILFSSIF